MTKYDYFISGVWFSGTGTSDYISHLMLHKYNENGNSLNTGQKKSKDSVITLIKEDKSIYTVKWKYNDAREWNIGAKVGFEKRNGVEYLRTNPDATTTDNLDNSLPMESFGL